MKEQLIELFKERCNIISYEYLDEYLELCLNVNLSNDVEYFEKHHILPRSLFVEFSDFKEYQWNRVDLTLENHYLAHSLLALAIDSSKMISAWWQMNFKNFEPGQELYQQDIIGADKYAQLKIAGIKNMREINKDMVSCINKEGKNIKVHKEEFESSSDLVGITTGKIPVIEISTGISKHINCCDFDKTIYRHHRNGTIACKNVITGERFCVKKDDKRLETGELVGQTAGSTTYKDSNGKKYFLETDDLLIKELNLVGVTKGLTRSDDFKGKRKKFRKEHPECGNAYRIVFVDENGIIRFKAHGQFLKVVTENGMPFNEFMKSIKTGLSVYSDLEAKTKCIQSRIKNSKFAKYIGWKAYKVQSEFGELEINDLFKGY